jgi:uncharacterized protein with von Willebrand factor type A (vWA) domain
MSSDNFDADMDAARGEFIFVLDRSGSMSGSRIKMARDALVFFLKSLPSQCFFNIVSFGSKYKSMFNQAQPVEDSIMQKTIAKV